MTQPTKWSGLLFGLLLGAGFGGAAGWFSRGSGVAPSSGLDATIVAPAAADESTASEPDQLPSLPRVSVPVVEAAPAFTEREAVEFPGADGDLFSPALLAYAEAALVEGWSSKRPDAPSAEALEEGLGLFQERTLGLPAMIGVQLADRLSSAELAAEDARTGGVFAVLTRLDEGSPGPLFGVVDSAEVFDQFFQREKGGPNLAGETALKSREPVEDGSTVSFPAGVFQLDDFGTYWRDHYPRDLTISGAGKDATLLVLRSDWSAYDTVRNLTLENCTIYANNNYLFDVREPAMSVTVRRCRLTGWTTGAGSSCLFGTEALALRVIDSEITGAYNRYPGYGQLFDVRTDGLLARFENCKIEACSAFGGARAGATLVFVNCTMRDILSRSKKVPKYVRLLGTQIDWVSQERGENRGEALKRDLNELFPDWQKQMRR